jgi:Protein of unknown function (DUF4236)
MPFRFRKRLRIFPGLALNLSRGGVSASLGVHSATTNFGRFGVQETMGFRAQACQKTKAVSRSIDTVPESSTRK